MQVTQSQASGRAEAERQGRCEAVTAIFRNIASGHIANVAHGIQAKGSGRAKERNRRIDIDGGASRVVGAEIDTNGQELIQIRHFARLIHDSASRTAAERHRRRPLQNLDFLSIERIAVVAAEIAHSVNEEVVASGETANGEVVALRTAFTGGKADTSHIPQSVAQGSVALLRHRLLRNNVDGLRCIDQRALKFGQRRLENRRRRGSHLH